MRLAFIANGLSYGGAEKMLIFVATELYKRGHIVSIFNTCEHEGIHQKIPQGIKIFNAKISTKNNKYAYLKRMLFCVKCAKVFKPEVLIGFLTFPNLYSVITGMVLRIPSVISERGDPYTAYKNNRWFESLLLKIICRSNGAVFQTDGAASFYPQKLRERSVIIPNPISLNKNYTHIDYFKREKIVVSLGRIENTQKRMDVLLNSFEEFHLNHPEYKLYIYGSGPDKIWVESEIRKRNLDDFVILKGVSNNSFEDISKCKIFAISSDYEGISNSLLEAMAVGMPVVSTDHSPGGARLLINDGENGLLTPIGDSNKFASALCRFAENEEFAYKCGLNASQVLNKFSPDLIIDKWEKYIQTVRVE